MKPESNSMPKAVEDCHALLAWIIPKAISNGCYGQGAERLAELGRQIGGWRRYSGSETAT